MQHYVLKFGRSVVFSWYSVSSTNKTDRHDITEILVLLKVVLNTITLPYSCIVVLYHQCRFLTYNYILKCHCTAVNKTLFIMLL